MCGRTTLTVPGSVLADRFDATLSEGWTPRYNITPGQDHPAIVDETPRSIDTLRWGLVPHWADDPAIGNRLINARAETVDEKPAFERPFRERRCLVVADGFYEWHSQPGGDQPYRIVREDGDPFAMAGLWDRWTDSDGAATRSLTVVTTTANDVVEPIHDRMPVILPSGVERDWLTASPTEAKSMLEPIDPSAIRAYPVSRRVNSPANDDPSLIEEVTAIDQTGLEAFGN
ncbi:MAG: SOS response-associated peptidase [Halobacteriota archaeon]